MNEKKVAIRNSSDRQWNLRCYRKGTEEKVLLRIIPGANSVPADKWSAFKSGSYTDPVVQTLIDDGTLEVGKSPVKDTTDPKPASTKEEKAAARKAGKEAKKENW